MKKKQQRLLSRNSWYFILPLWILRPIADRVKPHKIHQGRNWNGLRKSLKRFFHVAKLQIGANKYLFLKRWLCVKWNIVDLRTMLGVRGTNPCTVENPRITLQPALLQIYPSSSRDSTNCRSGVCVKWKKIRVKRTHVAQTVLFKVRVYRLAFDV